jgi:pyrroline-5-carboxylate reductase
MNRKAKKAPPSPRPAIGFVGGGTMATALIKGLLGAGLYRPEQVIASDIEAPKLAALRRRFKIGTTTDNAALVRDGNQVRAQSRELTTPEPGKRKKKKKTAHRSSLSLDKGSPHKC